MKQILIAAIASIAASCAWAGYTHTTYTGSDTNLKTLAVATDGKFVLGTGDCSDSEWDWTKERVYDGVTELQNSDEVVQRWFEPGWVNGANDCNWAGYQTESAVVVTHVSFITRHDDYASRARGCRFEGANTADFSDAVVLYAVPADADVETLKAGWVEVDVAGAALSSPFTYLRVVSDDEFCGNMIEVEFYGKTWADATGGTPAAAPQNFAAADGADGVTLSWDLPSFSCQSVRVVRATAPGGPFSTVATLSATTASYEDALSGLVTGVKYYYSACFLNTVESAELPGPFADTAAFRPVAEITFDAQTMTVVEYDHDYEASTATSAAYLFDGDTTTKPNVVNASAGNDGVKVGVDFGEGNEYVITGFEVFPSREWSDTLQQWVVGRSDGIQLVGSNDASDWTNGTAISGICDLYKENAWDDTQLAWSSFETTLANAYRYVYLKKDARTGLEGQRTDDFFGNVRELKLYGWNAAAAAAVLTEPKDAAAAWKGSCALLSWKPVAAAASYRVERRVEGGDWTAVADGLKDCALTDEPPHPARETYFYRVAAVGANGDLAFTLPFAPGGEPAPRGFRVIVK